MFPGCLRDAHSLQRHYPSHSLDIRIKPSKQAQNYDAIAPNWDGDDFNRDNGIAQHQRVLQFVKNVKKLCSALNPGGILIYTIRGSLSIKRAKMKRKHILSGSEFEEKFSYSRAVVDKDYVFVSGTTGFDYQTMTISSDPVEQAEQCFKNIESALMQAGSSLDEVVRVHYIFPNKQDFEPCWPMFKKYLGNARPAATMFIAGLLDENMKLEIEVTARRSA